MPYREQIELRLKIIDCAISAYSTMQHQIGISNADIRNILSSLISWKEETELLLHGNA